jgi:hypothetical protein
VLLSILLRLIPASGAARYQIIAGERRFRAATAVGLSEIPAYVKAMNDEDAGVPGELVPKRRDRSHRSATKPCLMR